MSRQTKFEIWLYSKSDHKGVTAMKAGLRSLRSGAASAAESLRKLGSRAIIGALGAVTAAIWQTVSALRAFAGQELSEISLKAALQQMGQYTADYYKRLINLANEYQDLTKVGDDVWLKQFAQLTRFGMGAENVDRVAAALKNLAGLMDGNVEGATTALQRALEGEFSMFSRYGIKLDLTGDKVKDLNNLFEMLAQKGGGAMEARAAGLQGAWDGVTNAWSDLKEEIGRTISKAAELPSVLGRIEELFKSLQESAKSGALHDFLVDAVNQARALYHQIRDLWDFLQSGGDFGQILEGVGLIIKGHFVNAANALIAILGRYAPAIGSAIGSAVWDAIKNRGQDKATPEQYRAAFDKAGQAGRYGSKAWKTARDEELERIEEENRRQRLEREGITLSERIGSGRGAKDIAAGKAILESASLTGRVAGNQRRAGEARSRREDAAEGAGGMENIEEWGARQLQNQDSAHRMAALKMIEDIVSASAAENRELTKFLTQNQTTLEQVLQQIVAHNSDLAQVRARIRQIEAQTRNNRQ